LVLMDIMMPDLERVRHASASCAARGIKDLPIIAVPPKAMKGDGEMHRRGASDYIANR